MLSHTERANELLAIARLLSEAQRRLDALAVGDTTDIPNKLKHALDGPIERTRLYARVLYLGETPSRLDTPDAGEICSVPGCDQPIAGWCATCAGQGTYGAGRGEGVEQLIAPTWCAEHLAAHCAAAPAGREHTPHWLSGE